MIHIISTSLHEQNVLCQDDHCVTLHNELSESQVIQLQQIFLTAGIHEIKALNIDHGRDLIQSILSSLKYYQNIGMVSQIAHESKNICDIVVEMKCNGINSGNLTSDLDQFFMTYPHFDFIWIEVLKGGRLEEDIKIIKEMCQMHHMHAFIPIIILTYEHNR